MAQSYKDDHNFTWNHCPASTFKPIYWLMLWKGVELVTLQADNVWTIVQLILVGKYKIEVSSTMTASFPRQAENDWTAQSF